MSVNISVQSILFLCYFFYKHLNPILNCLCKEKQLLNCCSSFGGDKTMFLLGSEFQDFVLGINEYYMEIISKLGWSCEETWRLVGSLVPAALAPGGRCEFVRNCQRNEVNFCTALCRWHTMTLPKTNRNAGRTQPVKQHLWEKTESTFGVSGPSSELSCLSRNVSSWLVTEVQQIEVLLGMRVGCQEP